MDEGATYDAMVVINSNDFTPTITWGTSPHDTVAITGNVPKIDKERHDKACEAAVTHSLDYTGLKGGVAIVGVPIKSVSIGSCTNGCIEIFKGSPPLPSGKK